MRNFGHRTLKIDKLEIPPIIHVPKKHSWDNSIRSGPEIVALDKFSIFFILEIRVLKTDQNIHLFVYSTVVPSCHCE